MYEYFVLLFYIRKFTCIFFGIISHVFCFVNIVINDIIYAIDQLFSIDKNFLVTTIPIYYANYFQIW